MTVAIVEKSHDDRSFAYCGATNRQGLPCQQAAGWGTDHVGQGRCKLHGGKAGRPVVFGTRTRYVPDVLEAAYQEQQNNPDLLKTDSDIALAKATVETYLRNYDGAVTLKATDAEMILGLLDRVSVLIDRRSKIESRGSITPVQMVAHIAQVAGIVQDALNQFVTDPDERARAVGAIRDGVARLGVASVPG